MTTVYLQRDAAGRIAGVYAKPWPGIAEEPADDASAEVQAYLHPPDLSIYRRAGSGRRARRFAQGLDRDPVEALVQRAKGEI
ncbi:MAG: hypothetical protein JNM75_08485 [Rhodospirillales bacterium]|nr:hypothetical protein [Rhodospirillales bacterium]